jgi:hypothetical protein
MICLSTSLKGYRFITALTDLTAATDVVWYELQNLHEASFKQPDILR